MRKASAHHARGPVWPWRLTVRSPGGGDYGDCYFDRGRKQDAPRAIERHIAGILRKVTPLSIGDHFVTYPVLKAFAKVRPGIRAFRCPP